MFQIVRHLGNAVRGPATRDVKAHARLAKELLFNREKILTYDALKQRCESLRLFIFWGTTGVLTGNLIINHHFA